MKEFTFLDIGCGDGMYEELFKSKFGLLIGVDISSYDLETAKKRLNRQSNVDFILADAIHLPLRDSSVDVVLCSEVLEHLHEPEKALLEIFRVFNKIVLITVPVVNILTIVAKPVYGQKLNDIMRRVGHVSMHGPSWWVDVVSRIIKKEAMQCNMKVIYLYFMAEPFASTFLIIKKKYLFKLLNIILEALERILSNPRFGNALFLVVEKLNDS
jgi:ubiquinone/menaquinone biosynthesis C-methylase UbiE